MSEQDIEEFVGIVLDRRIFEGRLMARWQEGYLEQCTSVPPDGIIVFVEHIAALVTKNYLNTQQLDANGKDSLKVRLRSPLLSTCVLAPVAIAFSSAVAFAGGCTKVGRGYDISTSCSAQDMQRIQQNGVG